MPRRRRAGLAAAAGLVLAVGTAGLAATASAGPAAAQAAASCTAGPAVTCTYTGAGTYTFTVPVGVTSLDVTAVGAAGGARPYFPANIPGGPGASVEDTAVPAVPGDVLTVVVGGVGGLPVDASLLIQGSTGTGGAGGSPGGGGAGGDYPRRILAEDDDGGGGGGYSGLLGPSGTPLVIAGGGGGAAFDSSGGGAGGTPDGGAGVASASCSVAGLPGDCAAGGGGGTTTGPGAAGAGAGGVYGTAGSSGSAGSFLTGGQGGASNSNSNASGGGGGGGYYGGGGGGGGDFAGSGGGGSSYGITGLTNETTATGPASVTISYKVPPLTVTTTSLPGGMVGSGYAATLAATGGITPYAWSVTAGALPPGLTLNSATGVISGTPSKYGSYSFTVTVTDSASPAMTAGQPLSITVQPAPLMLTTTSLPAATGGQAYSATLAASGGITPYAWSVTAGALPPGLTLNSATGVISGTPSKYGSYSFTVTVTDSASPAMTAGQPLSITVQPAPLMLTTTSLPAATGGQAYSATLAASGGITPYAWSVTAGALPPGLTLNSATGVISGKPDVAGTYDVTVTVTDSASPAMTASRALSITVSGPVITSLRPDRGPWYGQTLVLIKGTGLSCPPRHGRCRVTVRFGKHRALVLFPRPGRIWVISPPGSGTVTVTVTVGGVSSQATAAGQFTYFRYRFPW